jgi:hypothetical protein
MAIIMPPNIKKPEINLQIESPKNIELLSLEGFAHSQSRFDIPLVLLIKPKRSNGKLVFGFFIKVKILPG